jgi:hypothetical protein
MYHCVLMNSKSKTDFDCFCRLNILDMARVKIHLDSVLRCLSIMTVEEVMTVIFVDANHADDFITRSSITDIHVILINNPV